MAGNFHIFDITNNYIKISKIYTDANDCLVFFPRKISDCFIIIPYKYFDYDESGQYDQIHIEIYSLNDKK